VTRLKLLALGAAATMSAALVYAEPARLAHARALALALFGDDDRAAATRIVNIQRDGSGDFALTARLNGASMPMVLDTGASSVILTEAAARKAGLPTELLDYNVNVQTANGATRAAPIVLDRLAIGGLSEQAVPALVVAPGSLKTSLLGMSFLDRLHSWEVRGDRVELRFFR